MPVLDLILPGDYLYIETLASSWSFLHGQNPTQYYVTDAQTGMARPATAEEVNEYMLGGEYDEAMGEDALDELD